VKIFIETSIFIRFFTKDDESKYEECVNLFSLIKEGKLIPYTSNVVFLEILFILIRLYKFPKSEVIKDLRRILHLRNITLMEKTNTTKALVLWQKHNIKYGDCLIATQVPKGVTLITYDRDFSRLKTLKVATPGEIDLMMLEKEDKKQPPRIHKELKKARKNML